MRTKLFILAALLLAAFAGHATEPRKVSFSVDPQRVLHTIDRKVYGQFLEHIYHSCNGGLWGDIVWNRSFEALPGGGRWLVDGEEIVQRGLSFNDRLRFIHCKTGVSLGEARLTSIKDFVVTLDQDAAPFAEGQAAWPEHECAGWTVQDCRWEDSFQRLLIMSGPGTVRGCTSTHWGSSISLNTGMGLVGDITIADNSFIDVNPRPHGPVIHARSHNALGQDGVPPIERLVITGNTCIRPGGPALELIGIKESRIESKRVESPVRATVIAKPADQTDRQAILLRHSSAVLVKGNTLTDPEGHANPFPATRA